MQQRLTLPRTVKGLASFICMQACIILIFIKWSVLFPPKIYMKFYWNMLPYVPPLPCSLLLGTWPEQFCSPDANLVFLWTDIGMSTSTKDSSGTLFSTKECQNIMWQQDFSSASSNRNSDMFCIGNDCSLYSHTQISKYCPGNMVQVLSMNYVQRRQLSKHLE